MTLRSYQCWNSPRIPTVADPLRNFFNPGPVDQPVWSPVGIYRRLLPMESSPGNRRKPKKNPGRRRPFRSKHGPAKQDPASRGKTKSSSSSRDRRARKKKKKKITVQGKTIKHAGTTNLLGGVRQRTKLEGTRPAYGEVSSHQLRGSSDFTIDDLIDIY